MEKTDEKLASLIEKLQEAGFDHAPEVIDGAVRAMYYDGMLQLVVVGLFLAFTILFLVVLSIGVYSDSEGMMVTGAVGTLSCFVGLVVFSVAENPWLRVFDPEAAFYQQLMSGIIK